MNKLNKNKIVIIAIITICIFGIYYFFIKEDDYLENNSNSNILILNEENSSKAENLLETKDNNKENKIVIYVTGAVKKEGIYEIEENSRIADCIEIAGGLNEDADINNINLAYILCDGMKIHIPRKNENINQIQDNTKSYISTDSNNKDNDKTNNKNIKVNINTANQAELETLPGIGPSTALKIIEYRKENGKFNNIEDIKNVSGIGDSKFNKVKEFIRV
ncbi:MAG: competence protein ComEA [Clostridia bacterium]|jgi:competence protein ComEA|nr:competence protein ComEA [Clostridia bacterium]